MTGHVHQWKRLPVVTSALDYQCAECGEPESIVWVAEHAGKTIEDLDRMLVEKRGGVFCGEKFPPGARPVGTSRPVTPH